MEDEAPARLDRPAVMDRAIGRFARIDVELLEQGRGSACRRACGRCRCRPRRSRRERRARSPPARSAGRPSRASPAAACPTGNAARPCRSTNEPRRPLRASLEARPVAAVGRFSRSSSTRRHLHDHSSRRPLPGRSAVAIATPDGPAADHQRRIFRRQARRAVRRARRVHADLLGAAPAVLCREGRRAESQGRRRDRLHLGQRPVRHGAPGTRPTDRRTSPCSPTAMASSPMRSG